MIYGKVKQALLSLDPTEKGKKGMGERERERVCVCVCVSSKNTNNLNSVDKNYPKVDCTHTINIYLTFTKSAAEPANDAAPDDRADHPQVAVAVIDYGCLKRKVKI